MQWNEKRIGFHLKDVNPVLEKYSKIYLSNTSAATDETCAASAGGNIRVFVPLCGKSVDLAYLTTMANEVVGVEGIRLALEQFSEEHPDLKISAKESAGASTTDGFERFVGDKITLLKGDYFDLDATKSGGQFGMIFDRASMVAIEPTMREAYVDVIGELLAPGGIILLAVLERIGSEEAMKEGPPYSIPEATVRGLYGKQDWVESIKLLEQSDQLERKPEDRERYPDLDKLLETVYEIKRKA
jgi:thiopurine S-methyltransferase